MRQIQPPTFNPWWSWKLFRTSHTKSYPSLISILSIQGGIFPKINLKMKYLILLRWNSQRTNNKDSVFSILLNWIYIEIHIYLHLNFIGFGQGFHSRHFLEEMAWAIDVLYCKVPKDIVEYLYSSIILFSVMMDIFYNQ